VILAPGWSSLGMKTVSRPTCPPTAFLLSFSAIQSTAWGWSPKAFTCVSFKGLSCLAGSDAAISQSGPAVLAGIGGQGSTVAQEGAGVDPRLTGTAIEGNNLDCNRMGTGFENSYGRQPRSGWRRCRSTLRVGPS